MLAFGRSEEASEFGLLLEGSKVEMEPVLGCLSLRHSSEQQTGQSVRRRSDLEVIRIVVYDNPTERGRPPSSQCLWIRRVNDDLLPLEWHTERG